jgi:hypothetical protein
MADITMCEGNNCPIKANCFRFTAHKDEMWQSYANFEYKGGCPFFVNNKDWMKRAKK